MPAIITHHIFGEDASSLLPEGILASQEDLLAFLLGNQGPDPLWARLLATRRSVHACHTLASSMHERQMGEALMALRSCVGNLRQEDRSIGRAFALGMASHYILDGISHPLVYAQQKEIVSADPELADAQDEVHTIIEADLDSWMLWEKRNTTVGDYCCVQALARTDRIDRVAGAMISQVAWEVFSIELGAAEYGLAVRDYQLLYRVIDSPTKRALRTLSRIETLFAPHSRLRALAHPIVTTGECAFANLDHRYWRNPATGEGSVASFADLFHDALIAWPTFSKRFAEGDKTRVEAMIGNVNYYGQVV